MSSLSADSWRLISNETPVMPLPEHISPAFRRLIETADEAAAAALRRQVTPSEDEMLVSGIEAADPLGEARYCITPRLVHQYPNRVLLLTTGRCLSYCRYCFRREFTARTSEFISSDELIPVVDYLKASPQIREILVSGGDPLTGTYEQVCGLLRLLRSIRSDLLIRLCTRAPIFAPELFTADLLAVLRSIRPLWIIPHINHPGELGKEQSAALTACVDAGIPVQSQTVLLSGVNDDPAILTELFHRLVCLGVKPGYLFQADLARGTAAFRVPLSKAYTIWHSLKKSLSGLSLPQFAVDLPGGGGKFPLTALFMHNAVIQPLEADSFAAAGLDGEVYRYPE